MGGWGVVSWISVAGRNHQWEGGQRGKRGGRREEGRGLGREGEGRGHGEEGWGLPLFCLCSECPECALGGQLPGEVTAGTCVRKCSVH